MIGAAAAEFWWTLPVVAAAGTGAVIGLRRRARPAAGKRLAYDAARAELAQARQAAAQRRVALKVARADHARLSAERSAVGPAALAHARHGIRQAEKAVRAADAVVRAEKARVSASRAELAVIREPHQYPLARIHARHDEITRRWLEYETDPARRIAFPDMSDARRPLTAAFHGADEEARRLRPGEGEKVTAERYSAYRKAVDALERAFDAAERDARRNAGMADPASDRPDWQETAQHVITLSAEAIGKAADAAASALTDWSRRGRGDGETSDGRADR